MSYRYTGQVEPRIPATAPLSYRLSQEVYALDGDCGCPSKTGPAIGKGSSHYHAVGEDGVKSIASVIPAAAIIGIAAYFIFLRK